MSIRRLSLAAFTAWLLTKHERTKVGTSGCSDSCPLAKFLTQTTGIPYEVDIGGATPAKLDSNGKVVKDSYGIVQYDYENTIELPQWADHFIQLVDESDGESVSVMKALSIAESTTLGRAARMG